MRIALFSPLNPVRTGISDYTEEMLFELAKHLEIEIVIDKSYTPSSPEILSRFKVIPFDFQSFDPSSYAAILYHMGNYYEGHRYIYEALKKYPGLVVLHDYVLQGFYAERYAETGDFNEYRNLLIKYYGKEGERIAGDISGWMPFPIWETEKAVNFPLNEEILEQARALIVHSEFVRDNIKMKTEKPVAKINHHGHLVREYDRKRIRKTLGIEEDEILVCSAGFINKNKRYDVVLTALSEIKNRKLKYVIAGKDRGNILENMLKGQEKNVIIKGHLNLTELEGLISASDICINLRYPTMGESSGSLLRMMGYSKPVLVTNYGSYAELPDCTVLKVNPDIDERELIKRFLVELAEDRDFRLSVGREAASYIQEECSIEKCSREYAEFIKAQAGGNR